MAAAAAAGLHCPTAHRVQRGRGGKHGAIKEIKTRVTAVRRRKTRFSRFLLRQTVNGKKKNFTPHSFPSSSPYSDCRITRTYSIFDIPSTNRTADRWKDICNVPG